MRNTFGRIGAVTVSIALLGACTSEVGAPSAPSAPSSTERPAGQSESALSIANGDLDVPPIGGRIPPPPPPPPPPTCPAVHPQCSAEPLGWTGPLTDDASAYGCGPFYHYMTGNSQGLLGGIVALCPNTRSVRAHYGFLVECRQCLPAAPAGTVYVYLETFVGPGCQYGCDRDIHGPGGNASGFAADTTN